MRMGIQPPQVKRTTYHMHHFVPILEGFQGKGKAVPAFKKAPDCISDSSVEMPLGSDLAGLSSRGVGTSQVMKTLRCFCAHLG